MRHGAAAAENAALRPWHAMRGYDVVMQPLLGASLGVGCCIACVVTASPDLMHLRPTSAPICLIIAEHTLLGATLSKIRSRISVWASPGKASL